MPSESQGPTEFFSSLGLLTRLDAGRWVVVSIVVCGIVEETKCQSQRVGILCGALFHHGAYVNTCPQPS